MSELSNLYRSAVIDHNRNPRNFGELDAFTHQARGLNALCGDDIRVYIQVSSEDYIQDLSFEGQASAITLASASMMTEKLINKSLFQVGVLRQLLWRLLNAETLVSDDLEVLGDLLALEGVLNYPSRIASAKLPWETLCEALGLELET